MITASQLKEKALKKYPAYLQGLIEGNPFDRIVIPCDKKHSNVLKEYQCQLDDLQSLSKERKGFGYTIEWVKINSKALGTQDFPQSIFFATEADFLKFLKKEREVGAFRRNVNRIITEFPQLKTWAMRFPMKVVEAEQLWPDLLKVLHYFNSNPRPNLYIRQLQIEVHTKFIESNKGLLRELLDNILEEHLNKNESNFERRFNLKSPQPLIRLRLLDQALAQRFFNGISDISFPVDSIGTLCGCSENYNPSDTSDISNTTNTSDISNTTNTSDISNSFIPSRESKVTGMGENLFSRLRNIFIVENKVNFLTFPEIKDSMIIWGSGYGVANLKDLQIPKDTKIYYWGDLDAQGFEILSQFRGIFPWTKSLLMDRETFDTYFEKDSGTPSAITAQLNLTNEEDQLYNTLKKNNWRLEQEKIPQSRLIQELNGLGLELL